MKKSVKKESLEKRYFKRLMRDKSLEDKMRVFTEAKIIFSCGVGRVRGE